MYDSGARIGEVANIRVKDLLFDEFGVRLRLRGKTGTRIVRLTDFPLPYIKDYIQSIGEISQDELLFKNRYRNEPLSYNIIERVLKDAKESAKIKKPVNPHHFRHSRASQLANNLTEAQMCGFFGWGHGSKMPGVYVHLSSKDVDDAILKMSGKVKSNQETRTLKPVVCLRCKKENKVTDAFCNCGFPLNDRAINIKTLENELNERLVREFIIGKKSSAPEEIAKDKELINLLAKIEELKTG